MDEAETIVCSMNGQQCNELMLCHDVVSEFTMIGFIGFDPAVPRLKRLKDGFFG